MGAGILQGGNSTARIPTIQADVTVPTVTRPFRPSPGSNVPEIKSPIPAGAIGEAGEQLGRILEVQGRHQQILDSDAAEDNFKAQYRTNSAQNRTNLPGSQWANAIKQQMSDATQKMMDDPANAHIAPFIKARFPALANLMQSEELQAGTLETAKSQHDQYEMLQKNMAGQAGADFQVKPDGTFADGPTAQAIRSKQSGMVSAMWANNPDARNILNQKFDQMVTQERGQAIARNNPTLLQGFLNAHSDQFDPQQQGALMTTATQAIDAPMRAVEANHANARAAAIQYQNDYIKKNGQPDMTRLGHDAQFGVIEHGDYQQFTGRDYQMPTDPATLANYQKQIAGASDATELDTIKNNIRASAGYKLINGGDVPMLEGLTEDRSRFFKTEAGQETKTGIDQIRRAYQGMGSNAFVYNKIAPVMGLPTLTQIHENALADFQAATSGMTDRAKINAAWHKAIVDNQPDFEAAGIKPKVAPAPTPPMNDEAMLKAARAKGIIR